MSQDAESLEVNLTQYAALWGVSKATVDGMRTSTRTPESVAGNMPLNLIQRLYEKQCSKARAPSPADGGAWYRSWTPVDTDADMATQHSIHGLRSRSRQQIQDNPVATSAIKQYVTNEVGEGMSPRLVLSDQGLQEDLQNWWRYTEQEIDAHGCTTFGGLQAIAMRGVYEAGEIFTQRRVRSLGLGLGVPFQVELMEGDYLPHGLNKTDKGRRIRQGIEFDRVGMRAAYHFYKEHPGERYLGYLNSQETQRVKASEVHHMHRRLEDIKAYERRCLCKSTSERVGGLHLVVLESKARSESALMYRCS